MNFDTALSAIHRACADVVAAGFIDRKTGRLLSSTTRAEYPRASLELAACGAGDLFDGPSASSIERALGRVSSVAVEQARPLAEVVVLSDRHVQVFRRLSCDEAVVLLAVCRVSSNVGMALVNARSTLAQVEADLAPSEAS